MPLGQVNVKLRGLGHRSEESGQSEVRGDKERQRRGNKAERQNLIVARFISNLAGGGSDWVAELVLCHQVRSEVRTSSWRQNNEVNENMVLSCYYDVCIDSEYINHIEFPFDERPSRSRSIFCIEKSRICRCNTVISY
jgi:hypothetical protein